MSSSTRPSGVSLLDTLCRLSVPLTIYFQAQTLRLLPRRHTGVRLPYNRAEGSPLTVLETARFSPSALSSASFRLVILPLSIADSTLKADDLSQIVWPQPSPPRLVTSLRRVPPGTNGAVSLSGLALSTLGGLFTGLTCFGRCLSRTLHADVLPVHGCEG